MDCLVHMRSGSSAAVRPAPFNRIRPGEPSCAGLKRPHMEVVLIRLGIRLVPNESLLRYRRSLPQHRLPERGEVLSRGHIAICVPHDPDRVIPSDLVRKGSEGSAGSPDDATSTFG